MTSSAPPTWASFSNLKTSCRQFIPR
jgi:hypothetical protein